MVQTSSSNFKTHTKEWLLQVNFDTQMHLLTFKLIPPRIKITFQRRIKKNQNNFSNKNNSMIPQINNDLATPVTLHTDLKSCIHLSHNNSKTVELFNKAQ